MKLFKHRYSPRVAASLRGLGLICVLARYQWNTWQGLPWWVYVLYRFACLMLFPRIQLVDSMKSKVLVKMRQIKKITRQIVQAILGAFTWTSFGGFPNSAVVLFSSYLVWSSPKPTPEPSATKPESSTEPSGTRPSYKTAPEHSRDYQGLLYGSLIIYIYTYIHRTAELQEVALLLQRGGNSTFVLLVWSWKFLDVLGCIEALQGSFCLGLVRVYACTRNASHPSPSRCSMLWDGRFWWLPCASPSCQWPLLHRHGQIVQWREAFLVIEP